MFANFTLASLCCFGQATFYGHVDDEKVYKGTFFKIEYQLSDAKGNGFQPPSFDGFRIAAGPSRSFQTTVVNGKMNSYEGYSYTLQALNEGSFTIPPASIRVKGRSIESNPIQITVLSPLKKDDLLGGKQKEGDYFLVAEINRDTAYAGQQVILDYRIYTKKNIDKVDFKQLPDLTDFHWMSLYLVNESADQIEISGEVYTTKLLKRFAIFPKRPGTYTFDPAQLMLMMPKPRRRGFFFDNYEMKHIHSNSLDLFVNPLPGDKPQNFSGLVGSYTMEATSVNQRLTTDDALTVRMRIKGNGDANRMTIPAIESSPDLVVYDPKIRSKNKDQNQKKRDHFALIEYLYTAGKPGTYFVRPQFTYFDPDSNAFVTLMADSFLFNVRQGKGALAMESSDTTADWQTVEGRSAQAEHTLVGNRTWQLIWLFTFLIAIGASFWRWNKNRLARIVPGLTLEQETEDELENLRSSTHGEIAHRIENILGDYLRKKLSIEGSASYATLKAALLQLQYPAEQVDEIENLLNQCKFAAYSGITAEQRSEWIDLATNIIQRLSAHLDDTL